jgi:cytoskeleton protein RodZ
MAEDKNKLTGAAQQTASTESSAKLFGQMLRSAREVTGLTLSQLSETTRINVDFLGALEDGEFQRLPSPVFGRGFLRSICKALGLDPKDYIAAFDEAVRSNGTEAKPSSLKITTTEGVSGVRLRSESKSDRNFLGAAVPTFKALGQLPIGTLIGVCLVAVAIPTSLWLIGRPSETTSSSSDKTAQLAETSAAEENAAPTQEVVSQEETSQSEAVAASDLSQPENTQAETKTESVASSPTSSETTTSAVNLQAESGSNKKQRLDITVKETVKIKLNFDNAAWDTKELQPGNYEFLFNENAQLLVLDAAAVDIKFNGRSLGNLGNKGRVRRLSFAAKRPEAELGADQKL